MLNKEERKVIRARCEATTPGEWYVVGNEFYPSVFSKSIEKCVAVINEDKPDDAEFIAHARQDILMLLDALESETKRADEAIAGCDEWVKIVASEQICGIEMMLDRNNWKSLAENLQSQTHYFGFTAKEWHDKGTKLKEGMERAMARCIKDRDEWKKQAEALAREILDNDEKQFDGNMWNRKED